LNLVRLEEKKSLLDLYNNRVKVYKSKKEKSNALRIKIDKVLEYERVLECYFYISSLSSPGKIHKSVIILRRSRVEEKWSKRMLCEVRCSCEDFHYREAYANIKEKTFWGKPSHWNKIPAKKTNPQAIPSLCFHLIGAMKTLELKRYIQ